MLNQSYEAMLPMLLSPLPYLTDFLAVVDVEKIYGIIWCVG
jgi:hypothetical protein